jgi:hypothetical protein
MLSIAIKSLNACFATDLNACFMSFGYQIWTTRTIKCPFQS